MGGIPPPPKTVKVFIKGELGLDLALDSSGAGAQPGTTRGVSGGRVCQVSGAEIEARQGGDDGLGFERDGDDLADERRMYCGSSGRLGSLTMPERGGPADRRGDSALLLGGWLLLQVRQEGKEHILERFENGRSCKMRFYFLDDLLQRHGVKLIAALRPLATGVERVPR
jgi:hypothetical protein